MSTVIEKVEDHFEGLDYSPSDSNRSGYTTYHEPSDSVIAKGIRAFLIARHADKSKRTPDYRDRSAIHNTIDAEALLITVHECWSGYSEYTVTDQWQEISFTWGGHEVSFDGMATFFRALSAAEDALRGAYVD